MNWFASNLALIRRTDPDTARSIENTAPSSETRILETGSGTPTIAYRGERGWRYAHSRYDPRREAERLADDYPPAGVIIFLGLGLGYQIEATLRRSDVWGALVIETDPSVVRTAFAARDLSVLLNDRRLTLLLDPQPSTLAQSIATLSLPLLFAPAAIVPLRARVESRSHYFSLLRATIADLIRKQTTDMAIQSRFGRRWMHNIIVNMPLVARSTPITMIPRRSRAIIAAAGPSLGRNLDRLRRSRHNALLIATDTALPCLRGNQIAPDIVVSIDCQQTSYHHFLAGVAPDTIVAFDLASPPTIVHRARNPLFCASGHPLIGYLERQLSPLPHIAMQAGNVTHSALSLALQSGATEIALFGADFRYRGGIPYASGVYLYDWFRRLETRITPIDGALIAFMLRDPQAHGITDGATRSYYNPLLDTYRRRLEHYAQQGNARIIAIDDRDGDRDGDRLIATPNGNSNAFDLLPSSSPAQWHRWRETLEHYRIELNTLTAHMQTQAAIIRSESAPLRELESLDGQQTVTTLVPLIAHLYRPPVASVRASTAAPSTASSMLTMLTTACAQTIRQIDSLLNR